jgi:hypothetical protein
VGASGDRNGSGLRRSVEDAECRHVLNDDLRKLW